MQRTITIDCPPELLMGVHLNAEDFATYLKKPLSSTPAYCWNWIKAKNIPWTWPKNIRQTGWLLEMMRLFTLKLLEITHDDV